MTPNRRATLQEEARALGDPTRHTIFRYIAGAAEPVTVAELTGLLGLNHNAIRQHLAKLVDTGLITQSTTRAGGPGRPHLIYQLAPGVESRWGATGPYERLSMLLTEVIRSGSSPVEVGRRAGRAFRVPPGSAGDAVDDMAAAMDRQGFDPEVRRRGRSAEVVLHACPFASIAATAPEVVCDLHLGLAQGLAEDTDVVVDELVLKNPLRAGCRVRTSPRS